MDHTIETEAVAISDRERMILERIARGLSLTESAQELGMAPRTVERCVFTLRCKLQAQNASHLVAMALTKGLI